MEVKAMDRQNLLDIAIQTLGGVEGIFLLAERNSLAITARLTDGQTISYESADTVNLKVQTAYSQRGLRPATEISTDDMNELLWATGTSRPCILPPIKWTDVGAEGVSLNKIWDTIAKIESGEEVKSESGLTLTRIFAGPFSSVFA